MPRERMNCSSCVGLANGCLASMGSSPLGSISRRACAGMTAAAPIVMPRNWSMLRRVHSWFIVFLRCRESAGGGSSAWGLCTASLRRDAHGPLRQGDDDAAPVDALDDG